MKSWVCIAVLLALSVPVLARGSVKASLTIPAYPGSTPVMEVSVGEQDMLDSIKGVLSMLCSKHGMDQNAIGSMAESFDLAGLVKALQGLKEVKVVEMRLPESADVTAEKVTDFYAAELNKEAGWKRVYWRSGDPGKSIAVYSLPKGSGLFFTSVRAGKVVAGRTSGRIDLAKVVEWVTVRMTGPPVQAQKAAPAPQAETAEKK